MLIPLLVLGLLFLGVVLAWPGHPSVSLGRVVPVLGASGRGWYVVAADGDLWESDGSSSVQLTHAGNITQPAWTSQGLLYVEWQKDYSDLWLIDTSRKPVRLTQDSSPIADQNHWVAQPVAAPDGDQLYVLSDHNKATTGAGDLAIWSFDLRQESFQQVTHPPEYTGGDQDVTVNPRQPNDMVYTRYSYADNGQLTERLTWVDKTNLKAVPLTSPDHPSRQAAFAPDGTHLAFVQTNGAEEALYVGQVQVTQGTPQLTSMQQVAGGINAQPVWSSDGSSLAFLRLQDRQFQLWTSAVTVQKDGSLVFGSPAQVTRGKSLDATSRPIWVSDADARQIQSWH